jgi:hypothetical protein
MIDIQQVKTGVHCGIRGSPALEGCLHSYHIWNLDWSSINFSYYYVYGIYKGLVVQ